jgi:hypothetical protein
MTSLDDRLRTLFADEGPDPADLQGDIAEVRRRTRRRRLARRRNGAILALAAAALIAAGLMLSNVGEDGDRVMTTVPPANDTPGPPAGASVATTPSTSKTTATTETNTTTTPPAAPDIHDIDLRSLRLEKPCKDDDRSVTLVDGRAVIPLGPGAKYDVDIIATGYVNADEAGGVDVMVVIRCVFAGANVDINGKARVYTLDGKGRVVQLGTDVDFPHLRGGPKIYGATVTATVDVYAADDPACCPSGAARQRWIFRRDHFTLDATTALPPQGGG